MLTLCAFQVVPRGRRRGASGRPTKEVPRPAERSQPSTRGRAPAAAGQSLHRYTLRAPPPPPGRLLCNLDTLERQPALAFKAAHETVMAVSDPGFVNGTSGNCEHFQLPLC